ncbi:VOC family protein [Vibrio rhizosphaerae]|uniref:VOC family protein n=1 Tax=Vibrio rhizosphaerae TaxID=398736 RepID=A0ABU4IVM9_9VIBR|nr:VOC family protein [Vibrio rhizosphaerae]MDW6093457.1 VOC family protein [Vibrio rhizosphaerae]
MHSLLTTNRLMPAQMYRDASTFIDNISTLCDELQLDLTAFELDHIAMRVNDWHLAEVAHQAWLDEGSQISSAEINGRPIIVLALERPMMLGRWSTHYVELPYPAEGKSYPRQGWEHVEFVMPSQAINVDDFLQDIWQRFPALKQMWPTLEQRGIKVKCSAPKGEGERLANPTIAFRQGDICLKLHPHSLAQVIASERQI